MRLIVLACTLCLAGLVPGMSVAQSSASASESTQQAETVPMTRIVAVVAKKTGKRFVLDPRSRIEVTLIGQDPANLGYGDLLEILQVYGFAALEHGGLVRIIPDGSARADAPPVVSGKENRPDADWVSKVIQVRSAAAAQLVPVLRPLVPQQGHLAAVPCTNALVIASTVANVRQIESLVASLDTGPPYKPQACDAPPAPRRDN